MGRRKLLLIPLLLLVGILNYYARTTDNPVESTLAVEQPYTPPTVEIPTVERLFELTNLERKKVGVKPLVLDERLNQSAQKKVADMQITGLSHGNSDGSRGYELIAESMSECTYFGENLSGTGYGSENVVEGWMHSVEGHREAILNPRYDYVGYAVQGIWVAQHFCDID